MFGRIPYADNPVVWKYPESLKPLAAAVGIVLGAAWLAFSFYQGAHDVHTFLLGSPLWVGQGLAVILIVAMLLVLQHRAYGQLHPRTDSAPPLPKARSSWWRRAAAQGGAPAALPTPSPAQRAAAAPGLSDAELARIDHIREFWGATAKDASEWLLALILDLIQKPPAKSIFAHLLYHHPIAVLQNARERLGGALVENGQVPLKEVRDRFDEFAKAYMEVVKWVHAFETQDLLVFQKPPHAESYGKWHRAHDKLEEKLRELSKRAFLGEFGWALEHYFGANDHLPDTLLALYKESR